LPSYHRLDYRVDRHFILGRTYTTFAWREREIGAEEPVLTITPLERAALQLLANGKACDAVANCDLRTLFAKMGATSQAEAVEAACRRGLLDTDEVTREASRSGRTPS